MLWKKRRKIRTSFQDQQQDIFELDLLLYR